MPFKIWIVQLQALCFDCRERGGGVELFGYTWRLLQVFILAFPVLSV